MASTNHPEHGIILSGPRGGIGRRVGFRFRWATVQVQILSGAECSKIKASRVYIEALIFENMGLTAIFTAGRF